MNKDRNVEYEIYKVNKYYIKVLNKGCSLTDVFDFIYYEDRKYWLAYSQDFNGNPIDVGLYSGKEISIILKSINEDRISKVEFISLLLSLNELIKSKFWNMQSIFYKHEIIREFLPDIDRDKKLTELLNEKDN